MLPVQEGAPSAIAPYFVQYVIQYLKQSEELKGKFDNYSAEDIVYRGGLRIYTTIDLTMQQQAEDAINGILNRDGDPTAALCAVDPKYRRDQGHGGREGLQRTAVQHRRAGREAARFGLQGLRAHRRPVQRHLPQQDLRLQPGTPWNSRTAPSGR